MRQRRRSAMRRIPTGKARSAFRRWYAGRDTSSRTSGIRTCFQALTGFQRCWQRQAIHIKERLLKGTSVGGKTFKVHLDGYNQLPYLTGEQPHRARHEFFYFDDAGDLVATRADDWKMVWCEQRAPGGFAVWQNPLTCLRAPKIFNLRMDPYERADVVSDQYADWLTKNVYLIAYGVSKTAVFLQTFIEYPPSQTPASFSVDQMKQESNRKSRSCSNRQRTRQKTDVVHFSGERPGACIRCGPGLFILRRQPLARD